MSDPYLGEIRAFSFGYPPRGWAFCNGQTLPINQNAALFSLLGTTYGGNGVSTFQLPNLQGTLAIGVGGTSPLGHRSGEDSHSLTSTEIPSHTHAVNAFANPGSPTNIPGGSVILASASTDQTGNPAVLTYGESAPNTQMAPLAPAGGNQPHENRMPFLVMSYCIALNGIFPSRN